MQEEYKIIKDFENYEVSNFGNVKNLKTGRILKPGIEGHGYHFVILYKDGKQFIKKIHKLVANAFLPNPLNKSCVDHVDNDRLNNNINNLRYATYQENNRNRKISKNNKCGSKGVSFHKKTNKWRADICIDGKNKYLGLFEKLEDAVNSRVRKAEELFGEYINKCEKIININIENLYINVKTEDELELEELEKELDEIIKRK